MSYIYYIFIYTGYLLSGYFGSVSGIII